MFSKWFCSSGFGFIYAVFIFCLQQHVVTSACGYEACPQGKPDMLNVHIICHTHDDVGWLHTVDVYYDMWVKDIITSVVSNLVLDGNRKFSYVETSFFAKWWEQQSDTVREYVTKLVNDGQLEFVSGGWSMNDEAATHYSAIIDQMTLGLRWLNKTFGSCATPHVGWQVDTFGHSREQASLFSQMYFDGLFLGRVHYQDKEHRKKSKTMEFLWQSSKSLGEKGHIFAGILPNVYWPPKGFCFDIMCSDEELTEDNIYIRGHNFIALAEEQAKYYATNHIVMTMGMDFHFRDAAKWYRNLDFLIQHINSLQAVGMKVNVFYSTPACYLRSLNKANMTWPTMTSDFFPYASKQHEYWTGYFTSRPALKYYSRRSNALFQACKQLITFANIKNADILSLSKALGIVQHHDGITGTEKQHVSDDYTKQLSTGNALCQKAIGESIRTLILLNETGPSGFCKIYFCNNLNVSQCHFTEMEQEFYVIVYNSFGHLMKTYVRFPVLGEGYSIKQVLKRRKKPVGAQVIPIPPPILNLVERNSLATSELVFPAVLPPLGFSVYKVSLLHDYQPVNDIDSVRISTLIQDSVIENEYLQVKIDGYSGLLKEIVILPENIRVPLKQSFYYYEGMPGYRLERASGAYAFNPQFDLAFSLGENITYRVFKGSLVEEVHQYYTPWISQVIRVYRGQKHVEFDWVVGPIPVNGHIGKEIISRFDTSLHSNGTFYTDANGRETVKHIRNHQDTWSWNITENIAGNYYPVTAWIYIQDKIRNLQLSILTDRAEGGSSVNDGSIELMVHRRLLFDDGFGVNEALNEPGYDGRGLVVRGTHYLTLGRIEEMKHYNKYLAKCIFHGTQIAFMRNSTNPTWHSEFRGLAEQLPKNINLLTLEKLEEDKVLLRLEHFYEKDDDPVFSCPATVSLVELFRPFQIVYFEETNLSANKYLRKAEKLKWPFIKSYDMYYATQEDINGTSQEISDNLDDDLDYDSAIQRDDGNVLAIFTLKPMEIRTFIVKIAYNT